jgi:hypothetical protein
MENPKATVKRRSAPAWWAAAKDSGTTSSKVEIPRATWSTAAPMRLWKMVQVCAGSGKVSERSHTKVVASRLRMASTR